MKIKDILDKVELFQKDLDLKEGRIKLLEETLEKMIGAFEKGAEEEAGHESWESRFEAAHEINLGLKKRVEALEEAHPTVMKGPSDYGGYPPRPGTPHSHKEDKK